MKGGCLKEGSLITVEEDERKRRLMMERSRYGPSLGKGNQETEFELSKDVNCATQWTQSMEILKCMCKDGRVMCGAQCAG